MRTLPILVMAAILGGGCYVHSQPRRTGAAQPSQQQPGQVDVVEHRAQPSHGALQPAGAQPSARPARPAGAGQPTASGQGPSATFVGRAETPLDLQATRGTYPSVRVEPGFMPDPAVVRGRSGGDVDAAAVAAGCVGWIARAPDHVVELSSRFDFLRIYVESSADTTLVVRTPSGRFWCDDDTYGVHPAIEREGWEAGRYLVWVGSYDAGVSRDHALHLSELTSTRPSTGRPTRGSEGVRRTAPAGGPTSSPGGGTYRSCNVFNGQVGYCGSWYQGQAVLWHDGAYRLCDVFNGQISHCGSWYQGQAPAHHDGAWRTCDIFNGQISHCGSWYQGQAVVGR